jgi:hypothetical protein
MRSAENARVIIGPTAKKMKSIFLPTFARNMKFLWFCQLRSQFSSPTVSIIIPMENAFCVMERIFFKKLKVLEKTVFANLTKIKKFANLLEKKINFTSVYRKLQILINAIPEFNIVRFKSTMFVVSVVMDLIGMLKLNLVVN